MGTSDDVDEVIEADASVTLVGLLEGGLQLAVFVLGQDAPLFVQQLVEVRTAFSSHKVIFLVGTEWLFE